MLGKILRIAGEGEISSVESLSERLCVGPEIIRVMIDDLVRRGYLREKNIKKKSSCGYSCRGCSACNPDVSDSLTFWELTR